MPDRIGGSPSPVVPPTSSPASAPATTPPAAQPAPPAAGWTPAAATSGQVPGKADGFAKPNTAAAAGANAADDSGSGLFDTVKDKLVSVAWDQISRERSVDLAKLPLGKNATLGIKAYEQALQPDDDLVAKDPQRSQYDKANTDPHLWVKTGGVMDGGMNLSVPLKLPVGPGAASGSLGFSAGTTLEYSVLAPYAAKPGAPLDLAKNMTMDLPVTAANARGMAQGQEFTMRGAGSVGSSFALSGGPTYNAGPLSVGITASVNAGVSASGELNVNVKRLDGDKVYVKVSKTLDQSSSQSAGLHVGASLEDGPVNAILGKLPKNAIVNFAAGKAADAVKSKVEDYLQFEATASHAQARDSKDIAAYVLDLSKPQSRAAYDSLMKLDLGPAEQLARQGGAVRGALYDEKSSSNSTNVNVHLGPAKLFLRDTLLQNRAGELDSAGQKLAFQDSLFKKSTSGLFGGKRDVQWEGLSYQKNDGPPQTFFHLTFDRKDGTTREGDLQQFERFAGTVGAQTDHPLSSHAQGGLAGLFGGKYGHATEKLDMYFTRDGLQKLQGSTPDQVMAAYAQSAQTIEGSAKPLAWSVPGQAAQAIDMMTRYEAMSASDKDDRNPRLQLSASYHDKYGRNIWDDLSDYHSAQALQKEVASMKGQPEQNWVKAFSNLGSTEQFHFWKQMAAMSSLAGQDQTLVHQLSLQGDRIQISAKDAGLLPGMAQLDAEIGKTLNPP